MLEKILNGIKNYIFRDFLIKKLIKNGLKVGKNVFISKDVRIDDDFPWLISIGDDCTITAGVIILAHDASTKNHLGYSKIGKVTIGNKTFIGFRSIILPDVKIGNNVIIAAGSIVTNNVPDDVIVAGNPARIIGKTSEYSEKHTQNMKLRPIYEKGWTLDTGISNDKKESMKEDLNEGIAYIF
jgi:maltose O-acetyltransferase